MANYKLHGRIDFQGINISVENRAGSVRSGVDSDGHEWKTRMDGVHYGRVIGIPRKGADSEHVDVFVKSGPHENTNRVFVVHLMRADDPSKFDEDKCFLNFCDENQVKKCFDKHYGKVGKNLWGGVTELPFETFKQRLQVRSKGMIKGNVLHIVDLRKGYVEGYVRHDRSGKEVQVSAYENSRVAASASCLNDNSELCHGLSMGKLMARVEMSKSCRNDLRNVLAHLTCEYGDRGVSVFEDWVNPAKIGARLFSKVMASGETPKAVRANLTPAMERYERDFHEVLREEGFKRSISGCAERLFHILDLDLLKAHVKAHFRKDPKTGKLIFVHDYHNSVQTHPDHEHITFEKGEKVETKNGPGTIMGYDENKHVLRIKLDNGKYASVTPHLVKHLEKKEPAKEKTFDEKVKDANVDVEGILGAKEPEEKKQTIDSMDIFNLASILGAGTSGDIVDKWVGWIKSVEGKPLATEEYLSYIKPSMMNANDHIVAKAIALQHTGHQEALQKVYGVLKKKAEEKLGHPLEEEKPAEPEKGPEPEPKVEKPKKPKVKKEPKVETGDEPTVKAMTEEELYQQELASFDPNTSILIPMPKTKDNPEGIGVLNVNVIDTSMNPKLGNYGMKTKDGQNFPITDYEQIKTYLGIGPSGGKGPMDELSYKDEKIKKYVDMVKGKDDAEVKELINKTNDAFDIFHIYKALQNSKLEVLNFPMAWHALAKLNQLGNIKGAEYQKEQQKADSVFYEELQNIKKDNLYEKLRKSLENRGHVHQMTKSDAMKVVKQDLEKAGMSSDNETVERIYDAIKSFTGSGYHQLKHNYMIKHAGWSPYHESISTHSLESMELVEEYLNIAPPYPDPHKTMIYRGMNGTRKIFEDIKIGGTWQVQAPTSFTTSHSKALAFDGDTMIHIYGGIPVGSSVKFISSYETEQEIMTPGSAVLKIIKKEVDKQNPKRLIVHATIVDNKQLHKFKHLKKKED